MFINNLLDFTQAMRRNPFIPGKARWVWDLDNMTTVDTTDILKYPIPL